MDIPVTKIFLVDDDQDDYRLIANMLAMMRTQRFQVDWESTYESGLEGIQRRQHAIYILDYYLNDSRGRTGLDLLREAVGSGSSFPTIMLTGQGNREIDMQALKLGVDDYIDKTDLKPAMLERTIRYVIERKRVETELHRLYEQVTTLEQLKTDMIQVAAHDLRSPIMVILFYLTNLEKDLQAHFSEKNRQQLEIVRTAALRLQKITGDILSLERIEELAKQTPDVIDLRALVAEVCRECQPQAQEKQYQFDVKLSSAPLLVHGDAMQLREVLVNLIGNAFKYTPEAGRIEVRLMTDERGILFEVEDTGFGIPDDQQARLFQPFFRAKTKETEALEGTGLGLHLVKNLIVRYGGQTHFRSQYGKGSTFGFRLPAIPNGGTAFPPP